jgi:acyl-coenzyme A thioesterase PaaI-like protein
MREGPHLSEENSRIAEGLLGVVPALADWGAQLVSLDPGRSATIELRPSDAILGPYGAVLGGILVAIADVAAGVCAAVAWRSMGGEPIAGFFTESLTVQFLAPASANVIRFNAGVVKISEWRAVIAVQASPQFDDAAETLRALISLRCRRVRSGL